MPAHHGAHSRARRRSVRLLLSALTCSLLPAALTASASAATAPPTPQASTLCFGSLSKAPTADEPNLLNYSFRCNGRISSYTLVANRQHDDTSTIDDFSTTALVSTSLGASVTNESYTCEGGLPSNGVNCNAGAGGYMGAWNVVTGSFDTTDPYCANVPPGSRKGAKPEPAALVQLVVTDATGAEDGPFRLGLTPGCPKPKKHKHHTVHHSNRH